MFNKRLISYLFILLLNVPILLALSSGLAFAGTCGSSDSSCINRSGQPCYCTCPGGASRNGTCSRSASVCNPSSACPPPSPTPGCFDDSSCPPGQFCYQLSNTRICHPVCDSNNNGTFCRGSFCQLGCTQTGDHSCICNAPSPSPTPPPICTDGEKRCGVTSNQYTNATYTTVEECQNGSWVVTDTCDATGGYPARSIETCRNNPEPHCEPINLNCGNDRFEGCDGAPGSGFNSYDGTCSSNYETRSVSGGGTCCCPTPTPPVNCSNVSLGVCAGAPADGSLLASGQTCPNGTNQWGSCCCPTPYPRPFCSSGQRLCPPGAQAGTSWTCCFNECSTSNNSQCGCPRDISLTISDPACFGIGSPTPTTTPNLPILVSSPTPSSSVTPCSSHTSSSCPIGRCTLTFGGCSDPPSPSSNSFTQLAPTYLEPAETADTYKLPSSTDTYELPATDVFDTMYP